MERGALLEFQGGVLRQKVNLAKQGGKKKEIKKFLKDNVKKSFALQKGEKSMDTSSMKKNLFEGETGGERKVLKVSWNATGGKKDRTSFAAIG